MEQRQVKYLNNIVKADHGKLKRRIRLTLGFKSLRTSYATLKGFETMCMLKKGQSKAFQIQESIRRAVRLIERCLRLGPCAIAEAMEIVQNDFEQQAS